MKNKIFLTLASLITAGSMLAQTFEYQGVNYTVLDASAKTVTTKAGKNSPMATGHDNFQGDLVIPETVYNGSTAYTVTEIGEYSFYNSTSVNGNNNITSISLPKTLTKIGRGAFGYNENFSTIVIPDGITGETDGSVFQYCRGIETIVIPAGITKFGANYFGGCNNIKTVVCYAVEPPYTTPATFTQNAQTYGENITLYVPDGSQQAYYDSKYSTSATSYGAWHYMNIKSVDEWPGLDASDQPEQKETVNLTIVYPDGSEVVMPTLANAPVNVVLNPMNNWTINSVTHDDEDVTSLVDAATGRYLSAMTVSDNTTITIVAEETVVAEPEQPDIIEIASSVMMTIGESRNLGIYLDDDKTGLRALAATASSWSSSDESVATVSADGTVTGATYGDVIITANDAAGQPMLSINAYVGPTLTVVYPDGSQVVHYIPYNTNANIGVAASARWTISSASHDENDITEAVTGDGKYVSEDPLKGNSVVTLVAEETDSPTTGVGAVTANSDIRILVSRRTVSVTGADDADILTVYSVDGRTVYAGYDRTVTLADSGVYILTIGERTFKFAVL